MHEPVEYQVAERHVFGLAPNGLLAAAGLATLAAALVCLALGAPIASLFFFAAAALLGYLWLGQARRGHARLRDLTGFLRGTCGAWAAAGPELARIRLEATRLNKERARALYANDDDRLASLEAELQQLVDRAHGVLDRSRAQVSEERRAVARTVIATPEPRDDA